MREPDATPRSLQRPESPHAAQLRRGFPRLRFESPLEAEFRHVHRTDSLPQIRRNLWLGVVFVIAFSWLTHGILDRNSNVLMDWIRLALFGPILAAGLLLVHSRLYHRFYPLVCQMAAPVFGIGVAVLSVIAAQRGVSLISSVVTVTIYIYLMLGMMFYEALIAGALIFAGFVIAALSGGLSPAQLHTDAGILFIANVIGAMVCYSLERANRTNFLEAQLLIENASRDGLTGIHNRRVFDEHLDRVWPQAIRDRIPLALLLIDIDHFKAYNDYYGHQAGDECLKQVAWCLSACARRPLDVTARYGGEEFAIVLYDARRDHVEDLVRRIQSGIETLAIKHQTAPSQTKILTVSIGAACIEPQAGRTHFGFVQLADEALYAAKERGRNCVVIMDKEYAELVTGSFRKSAREARAS